MLLYYKSNGWMCTDVLTTGAKISRKKENSDNLMTKMAII